jgi:4-hydroxybenzoate polyprenyltransferase
MPRLSGPNVINSARIADAPARNWVDALAPASAKPYLKLARFDRPIGAWLLLFPTWWSQAMAELSLGRPYPDPWYLLLFLIGAFVMRGAGCTWNDIVDRDYDGRVERTALRPIPSGQVSVKQALAFGAALCLAGFLVLIQFNWFTVLVGASSLLLVTTYPFFKRFTWWPQVMLGLTFKWGALVGWAAVTGALAWATLVLYAACILWTVGYDTIYAHQDKEDDAMLGLKSSALRLGERTKPALWLLYGGAVLLWGVAAGLAGARPLFFAVLGLIALQLAWQILTLEIDDSVNCLVRFKSNRWVGWLLLGGLSADMMLAAPIVGP